LIFPFLVDPFFLPLLSAFPDVGAVPPLWRFFSHYSARQTVFRFDQIPYMTLLSGVTLSPLTANVAADQQVLFSTRYDFFFLSFYDFVPSPHETLETFFPISLSPALTKVFNL